MEIKLYQIDTFTTEIFKGNAAAICPLDNWLDDELLIKIAAENNLSETGFFIKDGTEYQIRWFTPAVEVDLCGHATLAEAYVLYNYRGYEGESIAFNSKSGILKVRKSDDFFVLDFPSDKIKKVDLTDELIKPFDVKPSEAFKGNTDYMLIFDDEEVISNMTPDLSLIAQIKARGIIVTARGNQTDFVSRFFAPQSGIDEDPVTGSSHTTLTPYWSNRLNKSELSAQQISKRGGMLKCKYLGERVEISGKAVTYLIGDIKI
ncbi:MAG: PhzF family phenazine biosynthesis protein [Bacteroidales bacterium]|nr:PhzF family phenazine biosynthesis protein [Bacteroidales bacterium]